MAEEAIEGWLTASYDYEGPRHGQIRDGVILDIGMRGITVDIGLKREGFIPRRDVERLGEATASQLEPGQEVKTYIVNPENRDGNLVLSLSKAKSEQDWSKAERMLQSGEIWQGKITGCNKGGVTARFGFIRGFIPGSHLRAQDKSYTSSDQRQATFQECVGRELPLKVIEVDRRNRRLILSERLAHRELRRKQRERLLSELEEGQVCRGTVSSLCDFGAFVDLGGADGLIHISELAWQRVRHPRDVLQVGDEVKVYVLRLDCERKRIGLSLKRTQPDPWSWIELNYDEGQLVSGLVTNTKTFGAFVALDIGVEGLIHVSELADPPPVDPRTVVKRNDQVVVRILRIEPSRRRIGLSLKSVSEQERTDWLRNAMQAEAGASESDDNTATVVQPSPGSTEASTLTVNRAEAVEPDVLEQA